MLTDESRWGELPPRMAPAINRDDHEAEEREEEGHRHGTKINDSSLDRREDRTSEDGHDEAGGADLGVFA